MRVRIHDLAHGGDGVGRHLGKVVFVPGTLPGELAEVEIVDDRPDFSRAQLVEVIEPSAGRTDPTCPHFGDCGGCQWQFFDRETQAAAKRRTLVGQLEHLGRIEAPPVGPALTPGPDFGYRNRMDFAVHDGRPALRARRTRNPVPLEVCLLLEPELAEIFARLGDLSGVRRLTLRNGQSSGPLVLLAGRPPPQMADWNAPVATFDRRSLLGDRSGVVEEVAGMRFRVTGGAFFQNNRAGAGALVDVVGSVLEVTRQDRLLDGYAGVGLFAGTVGRAAGSVLCVESADEAIDDLQANLERAAVPAPEIIHAAFEEVADEHWSVAVVNPPRTGLRRAGVAVVTEPRPRAIAYVACDPAALARDAAYLHEAGYRLEMVVPVDQFPQTFHIEAVARFVPSDAGDP